MYQLPALENDRAELNLMNDREKYFPHNDQDLHEMLCIFISKNNLKFIDPSLSVFSPFTCGIKDLKDDSFQTILKHLIAELNARLKSIPISRNEISKSQYVCSYLVAEANLYEGKFELQSEKNITGPNRHRLSIAQNAVQLKLVLSNCKRKVSEMEEDSVFVDKAKIQTIRAGGHYL
ncbi:16494_t:CDS:2 [Funneliformis geosporum]|uniref:16494_t:CDS:1 n=1 Tax=Funneliformis geosporum TaxID=1117311 RepID=A0A9W4T809_9GLOM|nr:16494_t:CDS:2 [Funneliformis geosporum]